MYKLIYTAVFSWPRSGLRQNMPERSEVRAATGNTTRATTRRASNVTSGRWRPHRSRSRRLTTSATHSTRPNGSTRPSRPCASCGRLAACGRGACRSVLQPRQRPVQAAEIQGGARKLQTVAAAEPCRPAGQRPTTPATKRLIDDNEDGGGGGDDDKNQDKDQNQDQQQQGNGQDKQDGDQQQDDKGQKGDDQEQQGDRQQDPSQPDKEGEGDQEGQQQPVPAGISRRSRNRCSMPSRPRKTARRTS